MIEPFTIADLDRIGHLQPEGWDDIAPFFRLYADRPFCSPVKIVQGGEIVAVGSSIRNGATGWIAHIIVAEEQRGSGLGKEITLHLTDLLERSGCHTRLLIATAMGEPLYRKLGWRTSFHYRFYTGAPISGSPSERIRAMAETDLPAVLEIDRRATGEDRRAMLLEHLDGGMVFAENDRIRGILLSTLGEGAVVAEDAAAGCALLKTKHSGGVRKAVLPEENDAAVAFLEEHGFELHNTAARMVHGGEDPLRPRMIFSRVGGHYG